jgi:predicted 3-demethylubiquinone-9 3-methyltransferase (glyoxalase superfamily)
MHVLSRKDNQPGKTRGRIDCGGRVKNIVPSLWFGDNNCEEALRYYVGVFPNSQILHIERYPDESLDEHYRGMSGKVFSAEFELNGQKFLALDGGPYYHFTEAISMTVECEDQSEIDYYWQKLSAVPESEQCGWVKDKFGLSWQIVPYNMGELLRTDAQIQCMMKMKKIVIQELLDAGK